MDKTAKWHGGGTEGEEWMACTAKVFDEGDEWWRYFDHNFVFNTLQDAADALKERS